MGFSLTNGDRLATIEGALIYFHSPHAFPMHVCEGDLCWCEPLVVRADDPRTNDELTQVVNNYWRGH